jgi:hypothetical protein
MSDDVPVVGPDGDRGTIPAARLAEALKAGFRVETPEETSERRRQAQFGDSALRAGVEGAARGLTLGLSDVYLGQDPGLAARREYNPLAAGVGEIGGSVAGLGLTGIGGLAERAGAAAFGAPGILSRAGAAAVRGGIEGAALGTGQAVSDLALSRDPLTAEAIAASLGHHVLTGAAIGGAGAAGLSLAGSGLGAAVTGAGKAVRKASEKLSAELGEDTAAAALPADVAAMDVPAAKAAQRAELEADAARKLEAGKAIASDTSAFAEDIRADMFRIKAAMPKGFGLLPRVIRAEKNLENALGDLKTLAENPGKALGPLRELQQQINLMEQRLPSGVLDDLKSLTRETEQSLGHVAPEWRPRAGATVGSDVGEGFHELRLQNPESFKIVDLTDEMTPDFTPGDTLKDLKRLRREGVDIAKFTTADAQGNPHTTYRILSKDAAKATRIVDEAKAAEGAITEEATRAHLSGRAASMTERAEALENRIMELQGAKNPRLDALERHLDTLTAPAKKTPLLSSLAQATGGGIGGALGHATGIPYAGVAGAWLGKEFGEATLKPLLRKVLGQVASHTGAVEEGAGALLQKLKPPAAALDVLSDFATATGVKGAVKGQDAFEHATTQIRQAAANPLATKEETRKELAGVQALSPGLAEAVADKRAMTLSFLAEKAPKLMTMGLTGKTIPPSDSERTRFARYYAAATDPLRALKELRAGTLMPETVETQQKLYPEMTARIKKAVVEQLSDPAVAAKLGYPMRLQLAMFLGTDSDPTTNPSFVAQMQSTYAQNPQKLKPPPSGPPTGKLEPATQTQRLTSR